MYGTREELCNELERMFTPDEPLALLIWTGEGVRTACDTLQTDDEEILGVLETIGNTCMNVYRCEGVTNAAVSDLLVRHREAVNRHVSVPARVLLRLLSDVERDLVEKEGLAWACGHGTPRVCSPKAA